MLPRLPRLLRLRRRPRRLRRRPLPPPTLTEHAAASLSRRRAIFFLAPAAGTAHRGSGPARPAALPRRLALRRPYRRAAAAPDPLLYGWRPWSRPTPSKPES